MTFTVTRLLKLEKKYYTLIAAVAQLNREHDQIRFICIVIVIAHREIEKRKLVKAC